MQTRSLILSTILIAILSSILGFVAVDSASYSTPIMTVNGKAMVQTDHGTQAYADVEYIHVVESAKPMPINTVTPLSLPNTSAPHGNNTCAMVDSNGNSYSVTTDQACDVLK